MSTSKPWHVSPLIDNKYPIRQVYSVSRDGAVVAHVNAAFPELANDLLRQIETHAELLAALRIAETTLDGRDNSRTFNALYTVRAAIAKAEGRS
jgi:hypothetical protein